MKIEETSERAAQMPKRRAAKGKHVHRCIGALTFVCRQTWDMCVSALRACLCRLPIDRAVAHGQARAALRNCTGKNGVRLSRGCTMTCFVVVPSFVARTMCGGACDRLVLYDLFSFFVVLCTFLFLFSAGHCRSRLSFDGGEAKLLVCAQVRKSYSFLGKPASEPTQPATHTTLPGAYKEQYAVIVVLEYSRLPMPCHPGGKQSRRIVSDRHGCRACSRLAILLSSSSMCRVDPGTVQRAVFGALRTTRVRRTLEGKKK